MSDTEQLNLPLLSASQAQKHVTVNEALTRLDGMVQLRLQSITDTVPPAIFSDGDCYGVPTAATGAWAGQAGAVAIAINGGWDFITPRVGFQAFVIDAGAIAIHDGVGWRVGGLSFTPNRAGLNIASAEIDVSVTAGPSLTTVDIIPERAILFGVSGVVTSTITGATSFRLGVVGDDLRFGSGLSVAQEAWISGPASPIVYWSSTGLLITAEGADFTGGNLRLAVHYVTLSVPSAA